VIRQRASLLAEIHPLGCSCPSCAAPAARLSAADRVVMLIIFGIAAAAACWAIATGAARAARAVFGG
jgi:hypothetical protein